MTVKIKRSWSKQYRERFRPSKEQEITRVECAFPGCIMPPSFSVNGKAKHSLCYAHEKQKDRGGPLRPFVPRTDVEARWEAWAAARASKAKAPAVVHKKCRMPLRVINTNTNGHRGRRYCYCPTCDRRVYVEADGRQRYPAKAPR